MSAAKKDGGGKGEGRASHRIKSKNQKSGTRIVDATTRKLVSKARLASLESDNYVEEVDTHDTAYVDGEEEEQISMAGGRGAGGRGGGGSLDTLFGDEQDGDGDVVPATSKGKKKDKSASAAAAAAGANKRKRDQRAASITAAGSIAGTTPTAGGLSSPARKDKSDGSGTPAAGDEKEQALSLAKNRTDKQIFRSFEQLLHLEGYSRQADADVVDDEEPVVVTPATLSRLPAHAPLLTQLTAKGAIGHYQPPPIAVAPLPTTFLTHLPPLASIPMPALPELPPLPPLPDIPMPAAAPSTTASNSSSAPALPPLPVVGSQVFMTDSGIPPVPPITATGIALDPSQALLVKPPPSTLPVAPSIADHKNSTAAAAAAAVALPDLPLPALPMPDAFFPPLPFPMAGSAAAGGGAGIAPPAKPKTPKVRARHTLGAPPNYLTVAAGASVYPARHFCSACGQPAASSCVRCGLRYCSPACQANHVETRCQKFTL